MSSLKVDNITGRGSTGFTGSVKSEGGNTTTDLQQGLAKSWVHFTGNPAAFDDSFNTSSLTDTAQGRFTIVFNNDFLNANYSGSFMMGNDGTTTTGRSMVTDGATATGQLAVRCVTCSTNATGTTDDPNNMGTFHGDLA